MEEEALDVQLPEAASLRQGLRNFLQQSDRITRKHRLTTQRYELLLMVETAARRGQLTTISSLREQLSLAQSSATELAHRLEDEELIQRHPGPRARGGTIYFRLTEEGQRRLHGALAELAPERRRLLGTLAQYSPDAEANSR